MDKKTINHYGWVIVISLVMAVMLAFATPFGTYIGDGIVSIAQGMVGTNSEAVKDENVENLKDKFSDILNDCPHENTHITGVKETTCGKDGYTGDLVCKDCLAVLKEGEKTKGTIHDYGTQVVKTPSTCSEQGVAEKTCKNCGHIEKVYLETVAHSNFYETGEKAATCTVDGNTPNRLCGVCNTVVEYGQTIKSTGHTVVKTNAVAATCSATGLTEGSHCSKCNEVIKKQTVIPKAAHAEINGGTAGIHKKCKVCGITTDTIHSYSMTTLGTATCTEGAIIRNQCNCGYYYDTQMPAKPHTEVAVAAVTATCTQKGLSAGTKCSVCNTWIVPQYESSLNPNNHTGSIVNAGTKEIHTKYNCCNKTVSTAHSYTEVVTLAATCTKDGTKSHQCSCGYSYTTTIAKTGHTIVPLGATTATCKTPGLTSGTKCSTCNAIIDQQVTSALNPNNHEGSIVNGGTANVHTKYSCCNKIVSTTHTYTPIVNIAATCVTEGKTTQQCSCGYSYIETIPASGSHDLTPVTLNTQYTSHYECSKCDAKVIPEGATYYVQTDYYNDYDYSGATKTLVGDGETVEFPTTSSVNDVYVYNDYEYYYGDGYCDDGCWSKCCGCEYETTGWGVRYTGQDESPVQILESINGVNVTSTTYTFADNYELTTAPEIPQYVTNCYGMFSWCQNLLNYKNDGIAIEGFEDYTIPDGVTNISRMFAYCTNISTSPDLPNSLMYMESAFAGTSLIHMPAIPEDVVDMQYTFSNCGSLTNISSLSHLTNLQYVNGLFENCTSLTIAPIFPDSVTNMDNVFYNCYSIVTYENSEEDDGYFYDYAFPSNLSKAGHAFYNCDGIYNMATLPEGVVYMYGTFKDCDMISNVSIPMSATDISYAYYNCDNLEYVYIYNSHVEKMNFAFAYCENLYGFEIYNDDGEYYVKDLSYAFCYCPNLYDAYCYSDKIESMNYTFYQCTNLHYVSSVPESVIWMDGTFAYISGDSYIYIYANPEEGNYDNCFQGVANNTYLSGSSTMLAKFAATDGYTDFSTNDKVRVVVDNPMPYGSTYYVQPTSNKLNTYTGATKVWNGDGITIPYPTPVQGDAFVYNGYEYRYQQAINVFHDTNEPNGYYDYWQSELLSGNPESSISGWGVSILNRDVTTAPAIMSTIANEPVTNLCATFEDCYNLTTLASNFTIPSTVTSTWQMFDECSSLNNLPQTFLLPDGIITTTGMFWENQSLTKLPDKFVIPSSVLYMSTMFDGCASLSDIITINATPTTYNDAFYDTTLEIYLVGSSGNLSELADTDNYDNVNLLNVSNKVPTGATYYRGIAAYTTAQGPGSAPKIGTYTGATSTYSAGSTMPSTPQSGDRFVYNGYEYAYNCYAWNGYINGQENFSWVKDETLNGWGVKVLNSDEYTYDAPLKSIGGKPVVAYSSMYEDCVNLEYLSPYFKLADGTKMTSQMFDECYSLSYLPDGFTIPNSVVRADGTFWQCESLSYLPDGFTIGTGATNISNMFTNCYSLSDEIEIKSKVVSDYAGMFIGVNYRIDIFGSCDFDTLCAIAATDGYSDYSSNDKVRIKTLVTTETSHSPYQNNLTYIVLDTYNFESADSVDITIVYQTESGCDWVSIVEGTDYVAGKSQNESRRYLSTSGSVITTTGTNYSTKFMGSTKTTKTFKNVSIKAGSIIFRTDGSVNNYYGAKVIVTPNYGTDNNTIAETAHYTYPNSVNYTVLNTFNYSGAKSVDIIVISEFESYSYDWISITEGTDYVSGSSYSATRRYLSRDGSIVSCLGSDSAARISYDSSLDTNRRNTFIYRNVNMTSGSIIFRTDGSVNDYYGAKVIVIPNY